MNHSQCALSFAELNQRLHRDEEWLKDFQEALNKSNQIQQSVCTLLCSFQERIDSLSSNVATLYTKSSVIQREQQNIRKLLSTVDATIQFHGKTTALENTIRDGNVMLSLDDYLEKMRTLKEAIAFFSTHLTYKNKLEHVKLIYEIGYSNIEAEFSNLVRYSCVAVDAKKLFECLDDDYELPSFRLDSFMTLRDVQKIHQIASWLIEHSDPSGERLFLHSYSQFRAENMMKPLQFIADQIGPNNRVKNAQFVKTALKKAANRIADSNDQIHKDNAIAVTLFMLSSTLVLIQLETEQNSIIFGNVSVEAEVLRQVVGGCLGRVFWQALRVVDSYDGSFTVLLPLARFMIKHANQFSSLSENVGESLQFASLQSSLYRKSILLIEDYRKRLAEDQIGGRFLPGDGNVHPISSGTLNLLKVLVQQQKLLNQLIQRADVHESPSALAGKFYIVIDKVGSFIGNRNKLKFLVQILKALCQNLRQKSNAYDDPALSSLFMLNNLQYISQTVSRERSLLALLQGDQTALPSSFETEAEKCLQSFLKGWDRVGEVFNADVGAGEDRRSVKSIFTIFIRDFDAIVEQQKIYCFADQMMAASVKKSIKNLVLQPFVEFSKKNSQECSELFESDRQLKYDAETIEMIIDRLFDATL